MIKKKAFFRRMLFSYLLIMLILLILFFAIVIFTSDKLAKESYKAEKESAVGRVENFVDNLQRGVSAIEDSINSSPIFSRLYFSIVDGSSLSSIERSGIITALRSSYALSGRYDIVDLALFLDDKDYAYMPSGLQILSEPFVHASYPVPYIEYNSIASALDIESPRYSFMHEELLYLTDFSYLGGAGRGVIAISLDERKIGNELFSLVPEGSGVSLCYNNRPFLQFGDVGDETVSVNSRRLPRFSVEISFPEYSFLRYVDMAYLAIPLVVAVIVFSIVLFLSFYFSRRNYRPISLIRSIIPESEEEIGDEIDSMIVSLKGIIGEAAQSRDELSRIKPYAADGAIHGMFVGDENMSLGRPYYVIAAVGFDIPEGEDDIKAIVVRVKTSFSNDTMTIYSYWRDAASLFLIITSDSETDLDNLMAMIHSFISGSLSSSSTVSIGVDCWRSDASMFRESCLNGLKALGTMVVGGKGNIYFAEDSEIADGSYYFPPDFEVRLLELLKAMNSEGVRKFLDDIIRRNLMTYALDSEGVKGLSDELYYAILHVSRFLGAGVQVSRTGERMTIEEILDFYYQILIKIMHTLEATAQNGNSQYDELETYVDSHYSSPNLSQKQLSDMFSLSAKSISLHYSDKYGITYLEYVTKLRIGKAKGLLLSPELTIEEVANLSGYSNTLTFRRNFKEETGFAPSEFRKMHI